MNRFPPLRVVSGPSRFPPIDSALWSEEMHAAAANVVASPRGEVRGPSIALLRSPELLDRAQKLGAFLRYDCSIAERLREFAICVVARFWSQPYEWSAHAKLARAAGVASATLAGLRDAIMVPDMAEDERVILEFCMELLADQRVQDATFDRTKALLGEHGTVELIALCGYYVFAAMLLNTDRTPYSGDAFAIPE
jgi:4-carboxymuconolactone decarboxylase